MNWTVSQPESKTDIFQMLKKEVSLINGIKFGGYCCLFYQQVLADDKMSGREVATSLNINVQEQLILLSPAAHFCGLVGFLL